MSNASSNSVTKSTVNQEQSGVLSELLTELDPVLGFFSDYPFAVSLVVIIISIIVANLATTIMNTVMGQVTKQTKISWDDKLVKLLHRPVFVSIVLIGFLMAILPLKLSNGSYAVIQSLVITVLIIFWTSYLLKVIRIVLHAIKSPGIN